MSVIHLYQMLRIRAWVLIPFVIGGFCEFLQPFSWYGASIADCIFSYEKLYWCKYLSESQWNCRTNIYYRESSPVRRHRTRPPVHISYKPSCCLLHPPCLRPVSTCHWVLWSFLQVEKLIRSFKSGGSQRYLSLGMSYFFDAGGAGEFVSPFSLDPANNG